MSKVYRTVRWPAAVAMAVLAVQETRGQVSDADMQTLSSKLPPAASHPVDFTKEVWPILEARCLRCHGLERPKSQFRLTSRQDALKGGENGHDIVENHSEKSPLIYYVSRLVDDYEMPPKGKGDPLTPEQVGVLRAWIDQGVKWEATAAEKAKVTFAVSSTLQFITVKGDERKFREHTGYKEGWNGGIESIHLEQQLDNGAHASFDGRILVNPEDYRLKLQVEKRDLGYLQFGFEQYREFYDPTGGYYPAFNPGSLDLNRDLQLDVGKAWVEAGLQLPGGPKLTLGYEYDYRNGSNSILQWGDVGTISPGIDLLGTDAKKIYPASKDIDEKVHILRFDLSHEINGIGLENNFRTEFYNNKTERQGGDFYNLATGTLEKYNVTKEERDNFQASDAFTLQKQLLDWLFVSGGYYFSRFDGEYAMNTQPISPAGTYASDDPHWFTDSIILEQTTHIFNLNTQLGPFDGLTFYAGAQSEWMTQRGFGPVRLDEGIPGAIEPEPATMDADLDRSLFEEHFGARYTKIPYTVLFAEGRMAQETIGQYEQEIGGDHEFLRDTDASSDFKEGRFGFTVSPWTRVSLTTQYKHRKKDSDYDHLRDETIGGVKNEGYSAFITGREMETDELSAKLTLRPVSWLKTTLTYQMVSSDYTATTEPYILPELVIPGFPPIPAVVNSPGGTVFAGTYDANVYSLSVALNPWRRISLSSTFSYRETRTDTHNNFSPVVVPYKGDIYSSINSVTVVLNKKSDLIGSYVYSWADYNQNDATLGLPLGLNYDWHVLSAGLTRRFSETVTGLLQYRFYSYDEHNTGAANNYTAHGILASVSVVLK